MIANCTWIGCDKSASHPRKSDDGEVWANLCDEHAAELESSEPSADKTFNPAKMLSNWVKAQGGSRKAAERMVR